MGSQSQPTEHLLPSHVRDRSHSFSFLPVGGRQNGSASNTRLGGSHIGTESSHVEHFTQLSPSEPHGNGTGMSSAPQSSRAESTISQISGGDGIPRSVRKSSALLPLWCVRPHHKPLSDSRKCCMHRAGACDMARMARS